jgi:hypothetical protein
MSDNKSGAELLSVSYRKNGLEQHSGAMDSEPTIQGISPVYESLPQGGEPSNDVRYQKSVSASSPVGHRERYGSITEETPLESNNPMYGQHPPTKPDVPKRKRTYKIKQTDNGKKKSDLLVYGVVICVMAVILLISVAALVISLFVLLGVIDTPLATEIKVLKANISSLEQQLQQNTGLPNPSPTTVALTASTTTPPLIPVTVINFSDCNVTNISSAMMEGSATADPTLPNNYVPEYLDNPPVRTKVVVEQLCWFSDLQGATNPQTYFALRNFTLSAGPTLRYGCTCNKGSAGTATCNFYFKECSLTTVYV